MPKKKSRKRVVPKTRKKAPARRRKPLTEVIAEVAKPVSAPLGGSLVTEFPNTKVEPVPVTLEAPGAESPGFQYLRFSAGLAYTTDLNGVTVEELSTRAPFKGCVSPATMEKWQHQDQWRARREALMAEWRRTVEGRMGQQMVQQAMTDLNHTDGLIAEAFAKFEKLKDSVATVNSFEGLINATVRLMEFRASLRGQVLGAANPVGQVPMLSGKTGPALNIPKPALSVDDARAAATAILKRRRDEVRAEQQKTPTEEKPAEETPALRLLPGQKA